MIVDVMGTVRLLHRVLGFLAGLSANDLVAIADGRRALALGDPPASSDQAPAHTSDRIPEQPAGHPPPPRVGGHVATPETPASPSATPKSAHPDPDYAEVAATLRGFGSVAEGAAYLAGLRLAGRPARKSHLVKLGAEMGLTLSESAKLDDLRSRLVNHAIGARKKYAGLIRW